MKKIICVLLAALLLPAAGCAGQKEKPAGMPADFSFALTWNCYGVSSYDSASGRLVKTTDATHPEDYVAAYLLSESERAEIWALLDGLSVETYPDDYDPDPERKSSPSETVILTVRANGREKTIACRGIALNCTGGDDRGKAFLAVVREIERRLTSSPAWQSLPDYERLYS